MSDTEHRKSKVSGAVSEASLDKLSSRSLSGVGEVLGKAPGVTVVNEGGDPNGSPKVNIRGLGGINGETPLYVVDGVVLMVHQRLTLTIFRTYLYLKMRQQQFTEQDPQEVLFLLQRRKVKRQYYCRF